MITKTELKYYSSLLKKKFRDEQNKFLIEGNKLILEALNNGFECEVIICKKDRLMVEDDTLKSLSKRVQRIEIISEKEFQKLQATVNSQGIIGVFKKKSSKVFLESLRRKFDGGFRWYK